MGKKYTCTENEMESVAAIAMHIGMHKGRKQAYEAAGESMAGFVGFYQAAREMGISLEEYADKRGITWGEDADWILTIDSLGDYLVGFMIDEGRLPNAKERADLVKNSIVR